MMLQAPIKVKMCGLTHADHARWACAAGAAYIGLVFFPPSPRHVTPQEALEIVAEVPPGIAKTALTVDPDDALIDTIAGLPIDLLQLHGKEAPERVAEIKARTGLPVMKAIGVRAASDLDAVADYGPVADQILIDAKPPLGSALPGGNGLSFDWHLVARRRWPVPWMLAGGLNPENVRQAVDLTGAVQVDVSSGIETSPGVKDQRKMQAFMAALR